MIDDPRMADEDAQSAELGMELVTRLHGLVRASRLYDANNRSFQQHLEEMQALIQRAGDEEITLVAMGDTFYVDGVRLRARPSQLGLFRAMRDEFESCGLGALRIFPGVTSEEWIAFLRLHTAARGTEAADRLPEALTEAGVSRLVAVRSRDIRSVTPESSDSQSCEEDERSRARQNFWNAARGAKTVLTRAAQTGRPAIRQARRVVQPIVDSILRDERSIVGLTAIKEHDEYTFLHCVNVSVLSLAMGAVLGVPRSALANLGVAALLHDIGKLAVRPEVLHKPDRLSRDEWAEVERHPIEGVRMLTRMAGLSGQMIDAMRVSFEHHMNMDGSGYPHPFDGERMGTFSRIVAVADVFDALTAHRAYRRRPFSGHEAMAIVLGAERPHADPAVLWALAQTLGLYPPGTVMRTRSGYVVLSVSPNPHDTRRPFCRVVARPGEKEWSQEAAERWDPMPQAEVVESVVPPEDHSLPVDALLAA